VRRDDDAHAPVDAGQLLNRQDVLYVAHAGTAKVFGEDDAHQAQRAHLLHDGCRELAALIPLRDMGSNLPCRKGADHGPQ
jgi:hypothetical protein